MVFRRSLYSFILAVSLVVALGCSRPVDDAQVAQTIQSQIQADTAVNGQVSVTSANGVVTLSGQAPNEAARALAARMAADTRGVKQVINNIVVVAPLSAAAAAPPMPAPDSASPAPVPANAKSKATARRPRASAANNQEPPEEAAGAQPAETAQASPPPPAPAPAEAPPEPALPPPPAPVKYTLPAGTAVSVRLIDSLDSNKNKPGDVFHATLKTPLRVDGEIAVPAGADVEGRVVESDAAGRFTGHATLKLELIRLVSRGHSYPLNTENVDRTTANRGKGTAETVGAGAAIGAIVGAIAGGGKGAGIGTLAGAGAGGAARAARKDKGINIPSETVLSFKLQDPLTVTVLPGEDDSPQR